jgi:hypothetical protein
MTVFAIIAPSDSEEINQAVATVFPNNYLKMAPGQWLVAGTGTAKDVSDRLGISEGKIPNAIVFTIAGYYGRAATNIWEWIALKLNQPNA